MQAGNPPFGARFQGGDVFRREGQSHPLVEELGGFGKSKAQVSSAQLGQLVTSAQTGQGQPGIFTGSDHQVHLRRQVREQESERIVNRLGIDNVVIIQDEGKRAREGCDIIDQRCQERFTGRQRRGLRSAPSVPSPTRAQTFCSATSR